ncbi:MAG: DUF2851 family protein [Verrucomicrobiota bacterium]
MPERLLQNVWHHQRLLRDQLRTLDGKPVRVLHPGFWNHEAGPDFRGAVLQIGAEIAKSGDVEIDLRADGWKNHGHDRNPNFANVILHVVWEPNEVTRPNPVTRHSSHDTSSIPTLALKSFLDAPINDLSLWLGSDSAQSFPKNSIGQCCAPLRELPEEKLKGLLQQAAYVRLQRKANDFQARARQAGWEQSLWEGIFRALGYKQNVWPMQRLAELLPQFSGEKVSPAFWQAWLLGVGGLLPTEPEKADDSYLRSIWDIWWRERNSISDLIFPKSLWRFNGMRPANFPQRRLALASHWLSDKTFFAKLENWFTSQMSDSAPENSLLKLLQVEDDEFWSWHWTFRSAQLAQPQPLIGAARISDLAINVILPWFWMRAVVGKNEKLQKQAEHIFCKWPAAEDNSVLRLARQRLFGGTLAPRQMRTAAAQQGLLQIVRDFCEHSTAICADCRFPDLVRGWNLQI